MASTSDGPFEFTAAATAWPAYQEGTLVWNGQCASIDYAEGNDFKLSDQQSERDKADRAIFYGADPFPRPLPVCLSAPLPPSHRSRLRCLFSRVYV